VEEVSDKVTKNVGEDVRVPPTRDEAPAPRFGAFNRLGYRLIRAVAFFTIRPYFRLRLEGADRLPATGPFLIAPNHRSYLDPIVLQAVISKRRIVFMMTREWYDKPLLRPFFRFMGAIPVDGEGRNREALERSAAILAADRPLGIFPEGQIHDGVELGPFHSGVAALAMRTGTTIVPAAILGSGDAFPKGRWFPRPYAITIRLGDPIDPGSIRSSSEGGHRRGRLQILTERIRSDVGAMLTR